MKYITRKVWCILFSILFLPRTTFNYIFPFYSNMKTVYWSFYQMEFDLHTQLNMVTHLMNVCYFYEFCCRLLTTCSFETPFSIYESNSYWLSPLTVKCPWLLDRTWFRLCYWKISGFYLVINDWIRFLRQTVMSKLFSNNELKLGKVISLGFYCNFQIKLTLKANDD